MEMTSVENDQDSTLPSNDTGHHTEDVEPQLLNHGDAEKKSEISEEELGGILEVIAATGKFWHDWETLKSLLAFRLKQVLAEYPEAQMEQDQQSSLLGESYVELVEKLDQALLRFIEGPPFTLQRLCEILLSARSIYPNLSKLALALDKNLMVTSTLTISTDPYPSSTTRQKSDQGSVEPILAPPPPVLQNGVEDEEMADAEEEIGLDNNKETTEEMEGISLDNKKEEMADGETKEETVDATSEENIISEPSDNSSSHIGPTS